jgi:hypothetical protein
MKKQNDRKIAKKNRLKAQSKVRRQRRKVRMMSAIDQKLKGVRQHMKLLLETIQIQEEQIKSLKTPAVQEEPQA